MKKIIIKILETCDQNYLIEVMITYTKRFEDILKKQHLNLRD